MTEPRRFLPNKTYFISRRCTHRKFFLKPTPRNNQIILYCLAVAALQTGVIIHAVCVLSNHYHIILTDPHARAAEFYGWLHKYVAKALNASYGRFENLWSSEKTSVITLAAGEDVLGKIVYTMNNPVAAGLVARGENWPGVWLYKKSHSQIVKRPDVYFSEDGSMPNEVQLNIEPPPQFQSIGFKAYEQQVAAMLEQEAQKKAEEMLSLGRSFMGVKKIRHQDPYDNPTSREKRFGINPKIAAKNKWLRIEAIQRHKEFQKQYRAALARWRAGDRNVVFPAGTYALRIYAGVKCAPG